MAFEYVDKSLKRHLFIGYDEREESAYQVCRYSIISQIQETSPDINIIKLDHRSLREMGLLTRKWLIDEDGSYKDISDKRPFSTQFAHSRFLIPALCKELGLEGSALFIDCDFLCKGDVSDLFDYYEDSLKDAYLVSCVKHNYVPKNTIKMDNCSQKAYSFKLWSALMMFNLDDVKLYEVLSANRVNNWAGSFLHQFRFLSLSNELIDAEIGSIPEEWQFIPNHSEERVHPDLARFIHYTEGGPWFPHMEQCEYSKDWWREYLLYIENFLHPQVDAKLKVVRIYH